MKTVKRELSTHYIPKDILLGTMSLSEIKRLYPNREDGAYETDKITRYIKEVVGVSVQEYCSKTLGIEWPKCPVTGLLPNFKCDGGGISIRERHKSAKITKENSATFREFCEKMKKERVGAGNPMHGVAAWNKGLNIEDSRVKAVADKNRGRKTPEESKKKQSISAKNRTVHGHTGMKHSDESKKKMSVAQAKRYERGDFNRKSSIQLEVETFLTSLPTTESAVSEYRIDWYSIDCAFPAAKLAIEVNGTFFHIDPRVYPHGPECAVQRRNFGRDKRKKAHLESLGWTIYPVWEIEVRNGSYKEPLLCKLKEFSLLKASE